MNQTEEKNFLKASAPAQMKDCEEQSTTLDAALPVCSYLCRSRELLFWNVLSHKSHAYMPLSVFLIFFRDRQESESVMSSRPDM